jgi:hypothetical protein
MQIKNETSIGEFKASNVWLREFFMLGQFAPTRHL